MMTVWPLESRYLAWLPRLDTNSKPWEVRMAMNSEDGIRFGMERESDQAMASSPTVTSVICGMVVDSGRSSR